MFFPRFDQTDSFSDNGTLHIVSAKESQAFPLQVDSTRLNATQLVLFVFVSTGDGTWYVS